MSKNGQIGPLNNIQNIIFNIRGVQVMLDSDLATVYNVETKVLNQAVKRNIERFPNEFRFQLTPNEYSELMANHGKSSLKSQIVTSSGHGGRRSLPYVFTEQGVSMLSAVLHSDTAISVSIKIINAFVEMRKFINQNASVFTRLNKLERQQLLYESETEKNFEKVFKALESGKPPKQGIFYNGQIFDAYTFVCDLIRSAKKSVVLVDNYIDDTVLTLLSKRKKGVKAIIYTKSISKQLTLDLKKHNLQYPQITIKPFRKAHDRFIIIDEKDIYHFGASLKDLGKKWFAFSKFEIEAINMLNKLGDENSEK